MRVHNKLTGNDLIGWGFESGKWFGTALKVANEMKQQGIPYSEIREKLKELQPKEVETIPLQNGYIPINYFIDVESEHDEDNLRKVKEHVEALAKIPTISAISVMPDGCPSGGEVGTIPVGGVVKARNAIHPGFHSADICCSVAASVFPSDVDCTEILDAGMQLSHFGTGGRAYSVDMQPPSALLDEFEGNRFLRNSRMMSTKFFGTQGDGNHFFYVGRLQSNNAVVLVTHHGSRKPGAELYKKGIDVAQEYCKVYAPDVPKHNAWIPADSEDGKDYWAALQLIRLWTKKNHFAIHDAIVTYLGLKVKDRFWNEHNFVFERNGYYYHAKGATPNYLGFSPDYSERTLIPLNMAAPILIAKVSDNWDMNEETLDFCPHGAGRNYSRTAYTKMLDQMGKTPRDLIKDITDKYDVRAFSGKHDISEFPGAYKNADQIIRSINKHKLTKIVDMIEPFGCIMAGHSAWSNRK